MQWQDPICHVLACLSGAWYTLHVKMHATATVKLVKHATKIG